MVEYFNGISAAAQGGIFFTFIGAALLGMTAAECASIAIIGGADGPTAIFVSSKLLSNTDSIGVGTIALCFGQSTVGGSSI